MKMYQITKKIMLTIGLFISLEAQANYDDIGIIIDKMIKIINEHLEQQSPYRPLKVKLYGAIWEEYFKKDEAPNRPGPQFIVKKKQILRFIAEEKQVQEFIDKQLQDPFVVPSDLDLEKFIREELYKTPDMVHIYKTIKVLFLEMKYLLPFIVPDLLRNRVQYSR